MERLNHIAFYDLGRHLKQVALYEGDVPCRLPLWDLWAAQSAIRQLLDGSPVPIGVSRKAAIELRDHLTRILDMHYYINGEDGARTFQYPSVEMPPIPGYQLTNPLIFPGSP